MTLLKTDDQFFRHIKVINRNIYLINSAIKGKIHEIRIQSGIIVNVNLKDFKPFLKKSFRSFSIKVALKDSILKVNVVFEGNFAKLNDGEVSLKSFSIKNKIIHNNTDLKQ